MERPKELVQKSLGRNILPEFTRDHADSYDKAACENPRDRSQPQVSGEAGAVQGADEVRMSTARGLTLL
jgi:hypothetical protein